MLPSSRMISQMTPAGARPASRARSTAPSVCPARTSTPPRRARSGNTWPGVTTSAGGGVGADRRADGGGAVGGRDAAPDAVPRVDRHRERGAERRAVLAHHHGEPEPLALVLGERQADESAPVRRHEVDVLGRDALGGDAEIALVLPVLVVHEDDHAPGANLRRALLRWERCWTRDAGVAPSRGYRGPPGEARARAGPACRPDGARPGGLDRTSLLSRTMAASQGPGPLAPVHRITMITAFLGALAYLGWELNQLCPHRRPADQPASRACGRRGGRARLLPSQSAGAPRREAAAVASPSRRLAAPHHRGGANVPAPLLSGRRVSRPRARSSLTTRRVMAPRSGKSIRTRNTQSTAGVSAMYASVRFSCTRCMKYSATSAALVAASSTSPAPIGEPRKRRVGEPDLEGRQKGEPHEDVQISALLLGDVGG